MAVEFPPNLDDGELWLPSQIIPDVGVCRCHHCHRRQGPAALRPGGYPSDLSQQMAALDLLDRNLPSPPISSTSIICHPLNLAYRWQVFMLQRTAARLWAAVRGHGAPATLQARTGAYFAGGPRALKPVQTQDDGPGPAAARVLVQQRQVNRFVDPVRRAGKGTGVFLPRVSVDSEPSRKPGIKGGEQERQPITRFAAERRQGEGVVPFQHPASMLALPQDWTY